jgi:predicted porin
VTFNRAAWVGLSGGFGEIRLGKQDVTATNDIDTFVSQMGNLGNFGTNNAAGELGKDQNSAVVYISPSFNGFQFQAGYSTLNTATAGVTTGDTTSYMVSKKGLLLKVPHLFGFN